MAASLYSFFSKSNTFTGGCHGGGGTGAKSSLFTSCTHIVLRQHFQIYESTKNFKNNSMSFLTLHHVYLKGLGTDLVGERFSRQLTHQPASLLSLAVRATSRSTVD